MENDVSNSRRDYLRPQGPVVREHDERTCNALVAIASRITDGGDLFSSSLLSNHNWAAVPVSDGMSEEEEVSILDAIRKRDVKEMWIVATNPPFYSDETEPEDYAYRLDLSDKKATHYFGTSSDEFVIFPIHIARYPEKQDFALLMGSEGEHYIIAGPRAFVEEALGKSINASRAAFQEWVNGQRSETLKSHLQHIADRCALFDGNQGAV